MPGLPCGGNLAGSMLETLTAKKLGKNYYVYKYTKPIADSHLPDDVWRPDTESNVAQYLRQNHQEQGEYLLAHLPRVCIRTALFDKCSKRAPKGVASNEEKLCDFIYKHPTLFFKVEGEP